MDSELWSQVKEGDYLITADRYVGPVRVQVSETDIKLYEEGPPARWEYPFGLTRETGSIKIRENSTESYANLADLIKFSNAVWQSLVLSWEKYQAKKVVSDEYLETFLELATEYRG